MCRIKMHNSKIDCATRRKFKIIQNFNKLLSGERFRKGLSDAAYVTKRLRLTVFIPIV